MISVALLIAALLVWPGSARSERPIFSSRRPASNDADEPLGVAYAMDLVALALAGGAPTVAALEMVADCGVASTSSALGRVAAALRWGVDERSAWATLPGAWRPVATAFTLAGRSGAAPASLLRQAADDLRRTESERVAVAGARAGVRIVLPLGLCFLPAFIVIAVVPLVLGLVDLPT